MEPAALCRMHQESNKVTDLNDGLPVGLVHGLGRGSASMSVMSHRLMREGFAVFTCEYPTRTATLAEARERVMAQIDRAVGASGRCDLVGHSLGGIVALQLKADPLAERVRRVVQLGSPNLGSPLADLARQVPGLSDIIGPLLDPVAEADLGPVALPQGVEHELGCIAGTGGLRTVTAAYGLGEVNDGKVSVESALGVAHGDARMLPVSHSMLPLNGAVTIELAHFLRHGCFSEKTEKGPE